MAISEFPAAKQKSRSEKTFMLRHVPVDVVSGGMTLLSWIGTLLLIGGGLFILSQAIRDAYHGLRGDIYRPTTGTIISGGVEWHSPDDSPDYYTLELTYDYVANDAHHTGTKLAFSGSTGPTFDTREAAEVYLAQQYPPGREITVYYDPALPDQAVLHTDFSLKKVLPTFFLSLLLMSAGGGIAIRTRRRRVRRVSPAGSPLSFPMGDINDYVGQKLTWMSIDIPRRKGVIYRLLAPDYRTLLGVIEWQHDLFRLGAVAQLGQQYYLVYESSRLLNYDIRVKLQGESVDLAVRKRRQIRFNDGRIFYLKNRLGGKPDRITDHKGNPVMTLSDGFEPTVKIETGAPLDAAPALALIAIYQIKKAEDAAD